MEQPSGLTNADSAFPEPLPASPLPLLGAWFEEARTHASIRNHDAMALATVDALGDPQVRMVLCRGFDPKEACFSFYTNRDSPKGQDLDLRGRASGVFYWDALSRQARISGKVIRASDADSDAYFASRHPLSRLAAWSSAQSRPVASRAELIAQLEATTERFGSGERGGPEIPRPPHWGGYRIIADRIELWVGRDGRLHDRAVWARSNHAGANGNDWRATRLQP
ncbi:MAG: pyridoxamine 5'-phosphate oxidase [Myxococcota bacterium]